VRHRLVDGSFQRSKWEEGVARRAAELGDRPPAATKGIHLPPVESTLSADARTRTWKHVTLELDEPGRVARLTVRGPTEPAPADPAALRAQGADTWALRAFRELDDALLHLRFNHDTVGLVLLHTRGEAERVLAHDRVVLDHDADWLAREIRLYQARVLRRLDNTARSLFAIVDPGSCFAGSLFELVLAADRSYMLDDGKIVVQPSAAAARAWPM
jgi:benzoyl-CoA-dihydrodiol lyase